LLELIETVEVNYAGDPPLKREEVVKQAASGMVGDLDRYSEFLDQQKYRDLQEDTRGSFGGVGIEIGFTNGKLSVIAPIEGTPASAAGLLGGDIIAFIDGTPSDDMKIMEAVHRIKGPPGTKVVLTIQREGSPMRDVPLVRAVITPLNIRDTILGDTGIGYVAIHSFSEHTADNLHEALERFAAAHVNGVILDLRSNPGGLLQEATRVVDLFLPGGLLIVSTEARDPAQRAKWFSSEKKDLPRFPLVVLVNEYSASASEIVSGALKDHRRAIIMGRRTFGKASVQSITPISEDRAQALRMTVARYYTPSHNEIHEVGIEPDVTLPPARYPPGMRRLFEEAAFNRFVSEVLLAPAPVKPSTGGVGGGAATASNASSGTPWLDAEALKAGRLASSTRGTPSARVDGRIAQEFRRWADRQGWIETDETWVEIADFVVEQVRIAVMRKARGEEASRRYGIEFDPQVRTAAALLKLSSATPAAAGPAR
jgi:carboxyl-terminal processing protease